MPIRKTKKIRCRGGHKNKGLTNHFLSYISNDNIEYYYCNDCREEEVKLDNRLKRINDHNSRQKHEASLIYQQKQEDRQRERERSIKEDLWDHVVEKELRKGIKDNYKIKFPKELLQLKRAAMKFERLIKEMKKGKKNKLELEQKTLEEKKILELEEIERLKRPLLNCNTHGFIYLKDAIKGGISRWTGSQRYKCRACMQETHRDYYERKKEYVLKKCADYRANNSDIVKDKKRKYWRKKRDEANKYKGIER